MKRACWCRCRVPLQGCGCTVLSKGCLCFSKRGALGCHPKISFAIWGLWWPISSFFNMRGLMLLNKILGLSPSNLEPWWVMLDRFMLPKESTARLERAALELFLKPDQRQKDASWLLGLSVKKGGPVWDPSCPENT